MVFSGTQEAGDPINVCKDESNYLFNEKAIEVMGMKDPVGKPFTLGEDSKGTIIGVVKNFHHLPLTNAIEPLVVVFNPDYYHFVLVKIRPGEVKGALARIESVWKKFSPDFHRFVGLRLVGLGGLGDCRSDRRLSGRQGGPGESGRQLEV